MPQLRREGTIKLGLKFSINLCCCCCCCCLFVRLFFFLSIGSYHVYTSRDVWRHRGGVTFTSRRLIPGFLLLRLSSSEKAMNKCGCQAWWPGRCHTPGTSICSANARVIRRRDDGLFQRDCRSAAAIKRMTAFSPGLGVYRVARAAIEVTYWRVFFCFFSPLSLQILRDFVPRREGEDRVGS